MLPSSMSLFSNIGYLVAVICAVWVIYSAWTDTRESRGMQVVWTIAAIVGNILTAIVYYFMRVR